MKLRNLIFSLFLAIGAIGFTACTGDDGSTGPAGPAGPAGPPGEVSEADIPEETGTYGFLKSWGSETGEITCSDSILTGSGPLPGGDDILGSLANAAQVVSGTENPDAIVTALCSTDATSMFGEVTDGEIESLDIAGIGDVADGTNIRGFVLVKTGRGNADPETVHVPSGEFNRAARVVTNKVFVGGKVFADLNFAANASQPVERLNLYNQCSVGTSPSFVVGDWRAVRITSQATLFADGAQLDTNNDGTPDTLPSPTVTTKVCVVLDAHPGVTKCFVSVADDVANPANNGQRIALYDGTDLTTVVKQADLGTIDPTGAFFVTGDNTGVRLCPML